MDIIRKTVAFCLLTLREKNERTRISAVEDEVDLGQLQIRPVPNQGHLTLPDNVLNLGPNSDLDETG